MKKGKHQKPNPLEETLQKATLITTVAKLIYYLILIVKQIANLPKG